MSMHACPWPDCSRRIGEQHWGCIEHWNALPQTLRTNLRRAQLGNDSADVTVSMAEIAKWIDENQDSSDNRRALQLSISAGGDVDFAAGITSDGRVFMIWPGRGEFSTLTKEESVIVVRAVRAMLTAPV